MPTVPVYQRQTKEQPLTGGFTQAPAGSDGMTSIGRGLSAIGDTMLNVADQQSRTEAYQALAEINESFMKWDAETRNAMQGSNARGLADLTQKWWKEQQDAYRNKLSPLAQKQIGRTLGTVMNSALQSSLNYEARQLEIGELSALNNSVASLSKQAIAAGPDGAPAIIAQAADIYRQYAASKGIQADEMIGKFSSGIHLNIVGAMMRDNPEAAAEYFNAHKADIDPLLWDKQQALIDKARVERSIENTNDAFEAAYRNGKIDAQTWQDSIRNSYSGDQEQALLSDATYRMNMLESNRKQADSQAENAVWGMINQGSNLRQIKASSQWAGLTDERQRAMFVKYFEDKAERARLEQERQQDKIRNNERNNWLLRDAVDQDISDGIITSTAQLVRYEPYFTNETLTGFANKIKKRSEIDPKDVQSAFEGIAGKKRDKWSESQREEYQAFQRWVYGKNMEIKRPGDVQAWADQWTMRGYGVRDSFFSNDPDTMGEAVKKGRDDFVIETPARDRQGVADAMEALRRSGIAAPDSKLSADEFYTRYYIDAARHFETSGMLASPEQIAAYAILRQQRKPITPRNLEYVINQLKD